MGMNYFGTRCFLRAWLSVVFPVNAKGTLGILEGSALILGRRKKHFVKLKALYWAVREMLYGALFL
jgi:hypothetical protein